MIYVADYDKTPMPAQANRGVSLVLCENQYAATHGGGGYYAACLCCWFAATRFQYPFSRLSRA